jgi:hypothetical protein
MTGRSATFTGGQSAYTLQPPTNVNPTRAAVKVLDGPNTFWLQSFVKNGATVSSGVLVYQSHSDGKVQAGSFLMDMHPDTATLDDAAMTVGDSWTNPLGNVTVSVKSKVDGCATVWVSKPVFPVLSPVLTVPSITLPPGPTCLVDAPAYFQP